MCLETTTFAPDAVDIVRVAGNVDGGGGGSGGGGGGTGAEAAPHWASGGGNTTLRRAREVRQPSGSSDTVAPLVPLRAPASSSCERDLRQATHPSCLGCRP